MAEAHKVAAPMEASPMAAAPMAEAPTAGDNLYLDPERMAKIFNSRHHQWQISGKVEDAITKPKSNMNSMSIPPP